MRSQIIYQGTDAATTSNSLKVQSKGPLAVVTCSVTGVVGNNPTVTLEGQIKEGSGWSTIAEFADLSNEVVGANIGVLPTVRAVVTNNGDGAEIILAVAYREFQ